MTKSQALKLVAVLQAMFPGRALEPPAKEAYAQALGQFDYAAADAAVRRLVETQESAFMPPLATVLRFVRAASGQQQLGSLSAEEAWLEFCDNMREPRRMYREGRVYHQLPTWTDPLVRAAGDGLAADVVALLEHGEGDEYVLRRAYCARYQRLCSEAVTGLPYGVPPLRDDERKAPGLVALADGGGHAPAASLSELGDREEPPMLLPSGLPRLRAVDDEEAS